jgi:hypothetical protein
MVDAIEAWAERRGLSRSEAARELLELGLTIKAKIKQPSPAHAARAKELARKAID